MTRAPMIVGTSVRLRHEKFLPAEPTGIVTAVDYEADTITFAEDFTNRNGTYPAANFVPFNPDAMTLRWRAGDLATISPTDPISEPMRRRLFVLIDELGLDDHDRHDLTEILLRRDNPSWTHLTAGDGRRLMDALEGALFVRHLNATRRPS